MPGTLHIFSLILQKYRPLLSSAITGWEGQNKWFAQGHTISKWRAGNEILNCCSFHYRKLKKIQVVSLPIPEGYI